ncbi:VanZ family protein [Leucobacter viscericola]|uniref:VanZ family protein n=1 Tax=Leucobacter viscericola TaxID=2714935 RepID=A0A6G7XCQ5_9MICO|nr:VanZ family protein [Leucobacter viscericola]QIK62390.1 VanZ family protein [Leucobacter viscericola]
MSTIAPPKSASTHVAYVSKTLASPQDRARGALVVLFAVYMAVLSWTILWELEAPWIGHASDRVLKLIPYVATDSAGANPTSEVLLNIALFIPFGVYLRLLAPKWSAVGIVSLIAGTSVSFEAIQYLLAIGVTDTADVINNNLGGLIGVVLCVAAKRALRNRTDTVLLRVMLIGTVGVLLLVTMYVLGSQLHHMGPPAQFPPRL